MEFVFQCEEADNKIDDDDDDGRQMIDRKEGYGHEHRYRHQVWISAVQKSKHG